MFWRSPNCSCRGLERGNMSRQETKRIEEEHRQREGKRGRQERGGERRREGRYRASGACYHHGHSQGLTLRRLWGGAGSTAIGRSNTWGGPGASGSTATTTVGMKCQQLTTTTSTSSFSLSQGLGTSLILIPRPSCTLTAKTAGHYHNKLVVTYFGDLPVS